MDNTIPRTGPTGPTYAAIGGVLPDTGLRAKAHLDAGRAEATSLNWSCWANSRCDSNCACRILTLMTTAESATIFDDLVGEIIQHHPRGRVLIAIDGVDAQVSGGFALSLAEAIRARSRVVVRSTSTATSDPAQGCNLSFPRHEGYLADDDYSRLRDIVSHFRDGDLSTDTSETVIPSDAVLIVDGRFLLRPELRGVWHFGVWLEGDTRLSDESLEAQIRYSRDSAPRAAADAIFDVTKAEAPARVWADSC